MVIMHVDANSAYLSWTAAAMLEKGCAVDLRTVPSAVAGDPASRHGIILAKSLPAKKYNIKTGESLFEARNKCHELVVVPPDYDLYLGCSAEMHDILRSYSPVIERYSIDESFMDYTNSVSIFGDPVAVAHEIKGRIKSELGFTVNIGISENKLLAKMAGELEKPDKVHTIWKSEIEKKLWPLPVGELFMVGRASKERLGKINIKTIGDLAKADPNYLKAIMHSHGLLIWNHANGHDDSKVICNDFIVQKGIGNSATIAYDIVNHAEAHRALLALTERVAMRLRKMNRLAYLVSVSVRTHTFAYYSHQRQLSSPICTTTAIHNHACRLFDDCWRGEPVRHLGVSVSDLTDSETYQMSFLGCESERDRQLDQTIDQIRQKYGTKSIIRGVFTNTHIPPVQGGVNDGNYLMMGGFSQ